MIETLILMLISFFFFNDTATTEIYTLSLHDALPILAAAKSGHDAAFGVLCERHEDMVLRVTFRITRNREDAERSEEHTSELQSRQYLVCRLLLEKKQDTLDVVHVGHTGYEPAACRVRTHSRMTL